ncbi:MAG: hypothetical protein GXZ05_11030 [Gammaproteobacteria bacterium]|nr:hypothetical protein [Gammaproteobacteria bacterium]
MTALNLIKHHQAELQDLEARAGDIGLFVARDAWDALESEVEACTKDSVRRNFIDDMPDAWALQLGMAFDEACAKWIEQPLYALDDSMREAMGERWCYDINRSSMQSLLQSLRIHNQYEAEFELLIKQAKPGLPGIVRGAWIDDEGYAFDHMGEGSTRDGRRVREQFYAARNQVLPRLAAVASDFLLRSLLLYRTALGGVQAGLLREQQSTS